MKGKIKAILLFAAVSAVGVASAFAAETDVTSIMTSSFTTIVDDMKATVGSVLPIALGVLGLTLAVTFGIKWFKKLTGKA